TMSVHYPIAGRTATAIAASVEAALREGLLGAGVALPTVRELARALRVSPATVASAYPGLRTPGPPVAPRRPGTRPAPPPPRAPPAPRGAQRLGGPARRRSPPGARGGAAHRPPAAAPLRRAAPPARPPRCARLRCGRHPPPGGGRGSGVDGRDRARAPGPP